MITELKRKLEDKLKWYDKEANSAKYEAKKMENEVAVNRLIKMMVIINTVFGVLSKLPSSFISIFNLIATFYYKDKKNLYTNPLFGEFYSFLLTTSFFGDIGVTIIIVFIIAYHNLFDWYATISRYNLTGNFTG